MQHNISQSAEIGILGGPCCPNRLGFASMYRYSRDFAKVVVGIACTPPPRLICTCLGEQH